MASTVPSVRIVKTLPFKGGTRNWSNRYSFTGGTPADGAHWDTLFDAIVAAEKTIMSSTIEIVEALGYAAGSDVPVRTKAYTTAGTFSPAGGTYNTPGEVAALVRWSTAARSTKNHPIYCFSYFHDAYVTGSLTLIDQLSSTQKTAMQTYATAWVTGFSDGTITCKRSTPQGHTATGSLVEEWVTHRDFPYSTSV